jgi:D-glycero-alpha-D-manno-heptose-7-phosphate kinase
VGAEKMIVTKTPLRVSFLGGGSDFPAFFRDNIGYTLGTAVNLFVYTTALQHSALADSKFKLTYSLNESVDSYVNFRHPLVRETLKNLKWENSGLHISTMADVPARTGLGSSSSFAVGLIKAISTLQGHSYGEDDLASKAILIERQILNEPGGWQDQIYTSMGGLRLVEYQFDDWRASPIVANQSFQALLNDSMMLVNVGGARHSAISANVTQEAALSKGKKRYFEELARLAKSTSDLLSSNQSDLNKLNALSEAINIAWEYKSKISDVSSLEIQETINWGKQHGAMAAKLCGAGGSGFILFLLDSSLRGNFENHFSKKRVQNIGIAQKGSEIVYFDDNSSQT